MKKKESLVKLPKVRHAQTPKEAELEDPTSSKTSQSLLESNSQAAGLSALLQGTPDQASLEAEFRQAVGNDGEGSGAGSLRGAQSQQPHAKGGGGKKAGGKEDLKRQGGRQDGFLTFEEGTRDDFAALLMGSDAAPNTRRYEVGDEVEGRIVTLGRELVYVDLGAPYEGTAKVSDYTSEDGTLPFAAGDKATFFITGLRGGITLGRYMESTAASLEVVEQALASGLPIEGRVDSANKGGFVVMIGDVEAFCPISQIELGFTEDASVHVGCLYPFKVIEVRDEGRSVVVSRAAVLQREAKEAEERLLEQLHEGDQVEGTVTRLADFGAFVDLGGIEGLIHISEIGYAHIDHPKEVLKEGERVKVEILEVKHQKGRLRISLSRRRCVQDPWETVAERYPVGLELNGLVMRTEEFGAFIELEPGIEGLVHVSEMSWTKRIRHASDVVKVGDSVLVRVQEVDLGRRRISLTMKSNESDPWVDLERKVAVGDEVGGVAERVEDFGVFVMLESLEVTALLPRSEMGLTRNETPYSKVTKGGEVRGRVLSVDVAQRKMALTLKTVEELEEEGEQIPTTYKDIGSGTSQLGTFGELLKKRLKE